MVRLTRIYTRGGDAGLTSLGDGARLSKASRRIGAIGAVDEANAAIGLARLHCPAEEDAMLARIQNDLFDLGADLCVPERGKKRAGGKKRTAAPLRVTDAQVERLEREIDAMNALLAPLNSFVLPGGTAQSAQLHLARTIMRRAERAIVDLSKTAKINPAALRYANRLSDHLFVLARRLNDNGARDVLWVPGKERG